MKKFKIHKTLLKSFLKFGWEVAEFYHLEVTSIVTSIDNRLPFTNFLEYVATALQNPTAIISSMFPPLSVFDICLYIYIHINMFLQNE